MSSIGACAAAGFFKGDLKKGKEISWEDVIRLNNIVGGEISLKEREHCFRGIISSITLENGVVSIMCPWVLQTRMDEDGDPVGDFFRDEWEVAKNIKLPLTIDVPKVRYQNEQEVMLHTALGSYASDNWVVRASEHRLSFWGGSAEIYLKGYQYDQFVVSVRELAPKFGLLTE